MKSSSTRSMREPLARRAAWPLAWATVTSIIAVSGVQAATENSTDSADVLEEVVVTAERTTQNLQQVSIAASVLSGDELAARGVNRVDDLQQAAPALVISNIGRSTSINIRGVGLSQTSPTSSPGVAYYINGALIPHENSLLGSFYDISSVEVLRGPQGTLAGQNSTGGAIFFRTPAPDFDAVSGYLDQTIGNYSWHRTVGAVNVPMGERFAARVAGIYDQRDSFTTNTGGSSEPGNLDYRGLRADLAIRASDALNANLRYEYSRSDNDNFAYKPFSAASGVDPFTISQDAQSRNRQTGSRLDGELRYDLNTGLQLRWVSSLQRNDNSDLDDNDRSTDLTPVAGRSGVGGASTRYRIWTHELNLISSGSDTLQWVAGAFYLTEDASTQLVSWSTSPITPSGAPDTDINSTTQSRSKSVFAQATYALSPQWKLIAGARYSWDWQLQNRLTGLPPFGLGASEATSTRPTGRIALNFQPSQDTLLYASVSRGYKAGGNNLLAIDPAYEPETNLVEEVGLKTTFLDNRLRLNTAIFNSDYDKIQVQSGHIVPPIPVQLPITQNTGKAKSYGGEVELTAVLGGLRINTGAAWLHSVTRGDISLINSDTGNLESVSSGTTLPFAPKLTFNAGVEYGLRLPVGELTPRLQWSHLSRQWATLFPSTTTQIDARNVLDFRLNYAPNSQWQVEGFVTNLTDETYVAGINQGGTSTLGGRVYGAPRQYGLRVRLSY